jgi:hypothetical protein
VGGNLDICRTFICNLICKFKAFVPSFSVNERYGAYGCSTGIRMRYVASRPSSHATTVETAQGPGSSMSPTKCELHEYAGVRWPHWR